MRLPPRTLLAATLLGWLLVAAQAQDPVIDQLIDPISLNSDGTTLTVIFEDLRQDPDNSNFEAQHSDNITQWTGIIGGTVTRDGSTHRYTLTALDPGDLRKFYRIIRYSTTAEDSDGDGLSNAFEGTTSTQPNDADSDDDGFNDGVEFGQGTDPNDPNDFPDQATLPIVAFTRDVFSIMEGDGLGILSLVTDSYTGPVNFTVAAEASPGGTGISTAKFGADQDHTLVAPGTTETTMAVGGTATILVPLVDDLDINPNYRFLFVDLLPGAGYRRGGVRRATVLIEDNDAFWTGLLVLGSTRRNFRVEMLSQGSTLQAHFVAGSAYDGLTSPEGTTTSASEGVVPVGKHLAPTYVNSGTQFLLASPSFTFASESDPDDYQGLFGAASLNFQRSLSLESGSSDEIEATRITGTFQEDITVADSPHLDTSENGTFLLVRDISTPPDNLSLTDLVAAP